MAHMMALLCMYIYYIVSFARLQLQSKPNADCATSMTVTLARSCVFLAVLYISSVAFFFFLVYSLSKKQVFMPVANATTGDNYF